MSNNDKEVDLLAEEAVNLAAYKLNEIDRYSWLVVHKYHHGSMPTEYDIREVDEKLYLSVLARAKELIST